MIDEVFAPTVWCSTRDVLIVSFGIITLCKECMWKTYWACCAGCFDVGFVIVTMTSILRWEHATNTELFSK